MKGLGIGGSGLFFGIVLLFSVAVGAFAWWYVTYPLAGQRRTAASQPPSDDTVTEQTQLIGLLQDYEKHQALIDQMGGDPASGQSVAKVQAEQQADLSQMRATARLMDSSQIPSDVASFLSAH